MNSGLLRTITPDEVGTYHRDGVLLLSGMFDKNWIELLNKGIDKREKNKKIINKNPIFFRITGSTKA